MIKKIAIFLGLITALHADKVTHEVEPGHRYMISPELWANPMEDWQAKDGWMFNTHSGGNRNVVSLTSEIRENKGEFTTSVTIKKLSEKLGKNGWVGFQIGLQGQQGDYRESAIYGAGLCAGITGDGILFVGSPNKKEVDRAAEFQFPDEEFHLTLEATPSPGGYSINLIASTKDQHSGAMFTTSVDSSWVRGLIAVTASSRTPQPVDFDKPREPTAYGGIGFGGAGKTEGMLKPLNQSRGGEARFAFRNWSIQGSAVKAFEERKFGPVWWTTYTVDEKNALRLLVQCGPLFPINSDMKIPVTLSIGGSKKQEVDIDHRSSTALFKLTLDDVSKRQTYLIEIEGHQFQGTIQAVPKGGRPLTVASLSCNDSTGFPHNPLVKNVTAQQPDFLTFHGDQIYEGIGGYGHIVDQKPNRRAEISYLRKYAMHGWSWRKLLSTIPSITIPDDHDVMHGNIWGVGGKLAKMQGANDERQDSGGYKMSPQFVNMVHRTQVGNLPVADNQPIIKNGITTYFTSFQYGPLDFLVLADRQFKSAPRDLLPEAKITNGWPQNLDWNPKTDAFVEDAELLGPQQEASLEEWANSPTKSAPFRIVVSQSPFLAPQTLPKDMHHDRNVPKLPVYKANEYAPDDEPKPDFDTNGWPQHKQKVALRFLKKAGAVHLVGDQHLGTTGQYGVDGYDDGTYWLATPAIANVWPRRWMPSEEAVNFDGKGPRWLGKFEDGFGNKFKLHAVANPYDIDREPSRLFDRAVGYGISRYDPKSGRISLEAWPYTSGPQLKDPDNKPYPGWPVTVGKDD